MDGDGVPDEVEEGKAFKPGSSLAGGGLRGALAAGFLGKIKTGLAEGAANRKDDERLQLLDQLEGVSSAIFDTCEKFGGPTYNSRDIDN